MYLKYDIICVIFDIEQTELFLLCSKSYRMNLLRTLLELFEQVLKGEEEYEYQ